MEFDVERLDNIDTAGIWNMIPNNDEAIQPARPWSNGTPVIILKISLYSILQQSTTMLPEPLHSLVIKEKI